MRQLDIIMQECDSLEKDGAHEWKATLNLTDEEFKAWYIKDNQRWWNNYRDKHSSLNCERCKLLIESPEQLGAWGGTNYHLLCMIIELSTRKLDHDSNLLYQRIKKVFS